MCIYINTEYWPEYSFKLLIATVLYYSVNPLYLMINEMICHFEEKNENKYLVLDDLDENKEVSKKYEEIWEGVKKETETINGGKKVEYGKDF